MDEACEPKIIHRFALVVSGAIALGAYEAGVLAQIYRDTSTLNRMMNGKCQLIIDAIAGSSAGAATALMLAQALAFRILPDVFEQRVRDVWVEGLDVVKLLEPSRDPARSLFTERAFERLRAMANLEAPQIAPETDPSEIGAVALWMTLTNLEGIPDLLAFPRDLSHTTVDFYPLAYADCVSFVMRGLDIRYGPHRLHPAGWEGGDETNEEIWKNAVECALASGAFPGAFPSRRLQRPVDERLKSIIREVASKRVAPYPSQDAYRDGAEGATVPAEQGPEPPDKIALNYVDGGVFANQPLGRAIEAVNYLECTDPLTKVGQRTYLIVDPDPRTAESVQKSLREQRHAETPGPAQVFSRLAEAYFNDALYQDIRDAEKVNRQLENLDYLHANGALGADLRKEIENVFNLGGKRRIVIERIPLGEPRGARLAGDFLGHFGGFLERKLRRSDFVAGQYEASVWMREWVHRHQSQLGIPADSLSEQLSPEDLSTFGWSDLSEKRRKKILAVAANRIESVAGYAARPAVPYLRAIRHVLTPSVLLEWAGGLPARFDWWRTFGALRETPVGSQFTKIASFGLICILVLGFLLGWYARQVRSGAR